MDENTRRNRGRPAEAVDVDFMTLAATYLEERAQGTGGTLRRFAEEHPNYAADLFLLTMETELATTAQARPSLAAANATLDAIPSALQARLRADARRILAPNAAVGLQAALAIETTQAALPARLTGSFAQEARRRAGLSPRALVARLGVGADIVSMLDEGDILPATVPATLIERLAEALRTTGEAITAALAAPRAGLAAYHAPKGHLPRRQISFDEAIRISPTMTPKQKALWGSGNDPYAETLPERE